MHGLVHIFRVSRPPRRLNDYIGPPFSPVDHSPFHLLSTSLNFSQVVLPPLLALSTSGRGARWLICYIASSVVALYLNYLTSPSLFPPLLLVAAVALTFRPQPSRLDSHCWTRLACSRGGWIIGSRLHCHPARLQESVTQNRASSLYLTSAG